MLPCNRNISELMQICGLVYLFLGDDWEENLNNLRTVIEHAFELRENGLVGYDELKRSLLEKIAQPRQFENSHHPQIFKFGNTDIRIVMRDEQPWWIAKDVCDVLGHTNPTVALDGLDNDERSKFFLGRQGEANIINESGLYALILRSNKPRAKKFRKWVTSEVLPSLRQTGRYEMKQSLPSIPLLERKIAIREKYAEARRFEALAKNIRALTMLVKQNNLTLPSGFIEKFSEIINPSIT